MFCHLKYNVDRTGQTIYILSKIKNKRLQYYDQMINAIIMEYQQIMNLLDNSAKNSSKFRTKNGFK